MFKLKNLQTKNEVDFFERLKCVFPGYYIGTQVAMSAIIETDNFRERPQFNTYYLDYVICDKKGEKPLMIIELDDRSHYSEKRKTQDKRKNGIIQSTGIPFIRYKAQISYDITDIANNTIPYLNGTKTPPAYETLSLDENISNNNNINSNRSDFFSNIIIDIKKCLVNKLINVGCSIIILIILLCFIFSIISSVGKNVTNPIKDIQNNTVPENKNETNIPDSTSKSKNLNDSINSFFNKFVTDSMKAGQNSIKFDKTPKKKNTNSNTNTKNIDSENNEEQKKTTNKRTIIIPAPLPDKDIYKDY
jgi:hypothetical protein